MTITLKSSNFEPGAAIPASFSRDGDDVSPDLSWSGVPDGTAELAMVCLDPDAPGEEPFVHWVHYSIPGTATSLERGQQDVGTPGLNDWGELGYGGPQPPSGDAPHHYHFRVIALDRALHLDEGLRHAELTKAIEGHVLDEGELVGTFARERRDENADAAQ